MTKSINGLESNPIRLSRSIVGTLEAKAVSCVLLDDGYRGMGKEVQVFKTEIAEFLEVPEDWMVCVKLWDCISVSWSQGHSLI